MSKIKTETLNITLPKSVVKDMDNKFKFIIKKRSEYIRDLIMQDTAQSELDINKQ